MCIHNLEEIGICPICGGRFNTDYGICEKCSRLSIESELESYARYENNKIKE
ncbi:MAG: hypothetical protein J1F35_08140 [Erysipelotrichales bacterium]|nr:hypothetical protein [Erysipelotrichales bacterium]